MKDDATNGPERPGDAPSYAAAARELDAILDEIESGAVDIDVLSRKVERAALLIRMCRQKLAGTELEITQVIQELEDATRPEGAAAADPEPPARV